MRHYHRVWVWVIVIIGLAFTGAVGGLSAQGRALPANFTEVLYGSGISNATAMAFAPDGRLFVLQQSGEVRVIPAGGGAALAIPFLTLDVDDVFERGLLGIAFDPDFATNNHLYLYYTVPSTPRRNQLSRFTANGNTVVPGSEVPLRTFDDLSAGNHNGGAIHFGPDGKLYVAVGDNAVGSNAQTLNNRHGKILRYNADGSIPTDNPFYNTASGVNRAIWALGLRNPYTFAFQPGTGRIFINDVGQGTWEEINEGAPAANFGWPTTEGDFNQASFPNFTRPRYAYNHTGSVCAVTGGVFYNPAVEVYPADYIGDYFFADFCAHWIKRFDPVTSTVTDFGSSMAARSIVDLRVGPDGKLYTLSRQNGNIYRYDYNAPVVTPTVVPTITGNTPPVPAITSPTSGGIYRGGQLITFSGLATDAEDGNINPMRLTWRVDFHHDDHSHPFMPDFSGTRDGSFIVPKRGVDNAATNVFYRITLTARDRDGETASTFVDVLPEVVTVTVNSNPSGLTINLDGQPRTTPFTFDTVAEVGRTISAPLNQSPGGVAHRFAGWDMGGQPLPVNNHTLFASADQTLTASYAQGTRIDLLSNGGMEDSAGGTPPLPLGWNVVTSSPPVAKRVCDVSNGAAGESLVSHEGVCSLLFRGGTSTPRPKLVQRAPAVEVANLSAGDTLNYAVCATGRNTPPFSAVMVRVPYVGGGQGRISMTWPGGSFGWTCQTGSLTLTGTPASVRAFLTYPGTAGKFWVDPVALWVTTD
ncbi:MAG: PQQ-dependent sugar dehydrogenase [Anaerolineae bacterium]|nr:PQQ-dependent sugar dehydrogenase [Anaerolineae bacterium]